MINMYKGNIEPLESRAWLSSPTMHGEEMDYVRQAYDSNWMSTVGENINELENSVAEMIGMKQGVCLSSGTAALHMAMKLADAKRGVRVFCSDLTFAATVNPVVYEGAVPVFIDSEKDTWNMSPEALEKAFEKYPDVKTVVLVHLYGTPAKMDELMAVCKKHNVKVVEDAAESFGATYREKQTGSFGTYSVISFNGNKIITGSTGGMVLTKHLDSADKAKKWSTQSREPSAWYQHKELGYNYRMSNVIAGIVRGQLPHLQEHIEQKKQIYNRYKEAFRDLPVKMNPFDAKKSVPNYWLSCMTINKDAMCTQVRTDEEYAFIPEVGKTCPMEILDHLKAINAEGRPLWKPMHMQPIFKDCDFVTAEEGKAVDEDLFERGLCLPSDNKMTKEQQDRVIEVVRACFN